MKKFTMILLMSMTSLIVHAQDESMDAINKCFESIRYKSNGDGTIFQSETNLTWSSCSEGKNTDQHANCGRPKSYASGNAWEIAVNSNKNGEKQWRLPTVEEVEILFKPRIEVNACLGSVWNKIYKDERDCLMSNYKNCPPNISNQYQLTDRRRNIENYISKYEKNFSPVFEGMQGGISLWAMDRFKGPNGNTSYMSVSVESNGKMSRNFNNDKGYELDPEKPKVYSRNSVYLVRSNSPEKDQNTIDFYKNWNEIVSRENKEITTKLKAESDFEKSADNKLEGYYKSFMIVETCYKSRKGYRSIYLSDSEYSQAKSDIKKIELKLKPELKQSTDLIWKKASEKFSFNTNNILMQESMIGQICKGSLINLANISAKLDGRNGPAKSF